MFSIYSFTSKSGFDSFLEEIVWTLNDLISLISLKNSFASSEEDPIKIISLHSSSQSS